jgi:hypothetical protein
LVWHIGDIIHDFATECGIINPVFQFNNCVTNCGITVTARYCFRQLLAVFTILMHYKVLIIKNFKQQAEVFELRYQGFESLRAHHRFTHQRPLL